MTDDELEKLRVEGDQPDPLFDDRVCLNPACGQLLERREGEPLYRFRTRVTCSSDCAEVRRRLGSARGGAVRRADPPGQVPLRVLRLEWAHFGGVGGMDRDQFAARMGTHRRRVDEALGESA